MVPDALYDEIRKHGRWFRNRIPDIFCVLQTNKISLDETVSIFRRRIQSSEVNYYHVLRSLAYFEDADPEPDPKALKGLNVSWQEVKSFFIDRQTEFEKYFLS